jgi:hypothetical protein
MRKVLVSMIAMLMISFTACNSGKKQDANREETPEATRQEAKQEETPETTREVVDTPASGSKLDEFKKLMEQAAPLMVKANQGDTAATKEFTEIAKKLATISTELQTELANDPEKMKEFQEIGNKFAVETQKAMQGAQ